MADPLRLSLSPLAAAAIGAVALNRYNRHRKRTYRELAARREALVRRVKDTAYYGPRALID
jgi:hypothetical protein